MMMIGTGNTATIGMTTTTMTGTKIRAHFIFPCFLLLMKDAVPYG